MRRAGLVGGMMALALACGGAPPAAQDPGSLGRDERKAAAKGGRDLVKEIYAGLRRGDAEGLQTLAATTAFVVGPRVRDVFTTREDAVVALAESYDDDKRHKLTSRGLAAAASSSGHAAWVTDSFELDGVGYIMSAVLSESDGLWVVEMVHLGRPLGDDKAEALAASGKQPAPAELVGGVDAAAREPARLLRAALAEPELLREQVGPGTDVVVLGSGVKQVLRGQKAIRKAWKKRVLGGASYALVGDLRAGVTPDGSLAWVTGNVEVTVGEARAVRKRLSCVYQRDAAGWQLVAMHWSVGR